MNIPLEYHNIVLNEFKEIEKLIRSAKSPEDKLYFFSASFGVVNRVMNIHSDPTLIFIHQVLQSSHQLMANRLAGNKNSELIFSALPSKIFDKFFSLFYDLIKVFEEQNKIKIWEVLEQFTNLSYATTGNGYYMYVRNKIII